MNNTRDGATLIVEMRKLFNFVDEERVRVQ
jgi:hypothetical protein